MAKKSPVTDETRQGLAENAQQEQLYAISQFLSKVKFAPRVMGVDEADVWRKLEQLCQLYEDALTAERMKSAQLQENYAQLQQKHNDLTVKAKQILAAYQKLSGRAKSDG